MRRKLFTLMAALMLVLTTSVAPLKVAAQGLVEYIIMMVVGIGADEALESYYVVGKVPPGNATAQEGRYASGGIFTVIVTIGDEAGIHGNAVCTQTVQTTVDFHPGINTLTTAAIRTNESVFLQVGEEEPVELDSCFQGKNRFLLSFAVPFLPGTTQKRSHTSELPIWNWRQNVVGYSIYNILTGKTLTSGIREVVPDGFQQTFPVPLPLP